MKIFYHIHFDLSNGGRKEIDFVRVGASDEGPGHDEVQFWWSYWHFFKEKTATLVSSRCSGCSYLNRVELQNGCLSRAHVNTFIPSTLGGNCITQDGIDEDKLKENMDLAISAYIERFNLCSCGGVIHLFKGAVESDILKQRE